MIRNDADDVRVDGSFPKYCRPRLFFLRDLHPVARAVRTAASAATNGDELEPLLERCALRDQQALADLYAPIYTLSLDVHAAQSSEMWLRKTLMCERAATC